MRKGLPGMQSLLHARCPEQRMRHAQDAKKGKGEQRQKLRQEDQQSVQQGRSIEERYMEKAEARARGEDAPDVAFEKRLEALKRRATAAVKVSAGFGRLISMRACISRMLGAC